MDQEPVQVDQADGLEEPEAGTQHLHEEQAAETQPLHEEEETETQLLHDEEQDADVKAKPLIRPFKKASPFLMKALLARQIRDNPRCLRAMRQKGYELRWRARKVKPMANSKVNPIQLFLMWWHEGKKEWTGRQLKPFGQTKLMLSLPPMLYDTVQVTPLDTGAWVEKGTGEYKYAFQPVVPGAPYYDEAVHGSALSDLAYVIKVWNEDLVHFLSYGRLDGSGKYVGAEYMPDTWESDEVDGKPDKMFECLTRAHNSDSNVLLRRYGEAKSTENGLAVIVAPRFQTRVLAKTFGECVPRKTIPIASQRSIDAWREWAKTQDNCHEHEVHIDRMEEMILTSVAGTSDHLSMAKTNFLSECMPGVQLMPQQVADFTLTGVMAIVTLELASLKKSTIGSTDQHTISPNIGSACFIMNGQNPNEAAGATISASDIFDADECDDDEALAEIGKSDSPLAPKPRTVTNALKRGAPEKAKGKAKKRAL